MGIYDAVFRNHPDILMVIRAERDGRRFRVIDVNDRLEASSGFTRSALVGTTPEDSLPPDQASYLSAAYRRCLESGSPVEIEYSFDIPTGHTTWQVRISCLGPAHPDLLLASARDITLSRDIIQQLNSLDGCIPGFVYQLIYTPEGEWHYTHVSTNVHSLFGVAVEDVLADAEVLLGMIHPDDRERVIAESMASIDTMEPWFSEFRMCLADGGVLWLEARDVPSKLADGTRIWTGYANDISTKKTLESSLQASEARYRRLVENANDIIFTLEPDGRPGYVSPTWTRWLGQQPEQVMASRFRDFLHPDDHAPFAEYLQRQGGDAVAGEFDCRLRNRDGGWQWFSLNAALLSEPGARPAFMIIARDIGSRKALEREILYLAHHDPLTGLANRAEFFAQLEQRMRLADRQDQVLALLFIDLDGFKTVNDRLGHRAGDLLLEEVGRRLRGALRASDLVGRAGGDEFMVIPSGPVAKAAGLVLGRKLCDRLSQPFDLAGNQVRITASIGVAFYPTDGDTGEALIHAADMAMYRAKSAGGGRVTLAVEHPTPFQG